MRAITMDTRIRKMAAICVACGDHHKVGEKRNLQASKDVLQLWEFLFCSLLQSRVLPDGILRDAKICRKCYTAYERLLKVYYKNIRSFVLATLQHNLHFDFVGTVKSERQFGQSSRRSWSEP